MWSIWSLLVVVGVCITLLVLAGLEDCLRALAVLLLVLKFG
jgi:hypothetical protein